MDQTFFDLAIYVPLIPLIGFLLQAFFGGLVVRWLGAAAGKKVMGCLAVLSVLAPFGIAVVLYLGLAGASPGVTQIVHVLPWIDLAGFRAPFELVVDPLSVTMVLIITGVGALIHLYATGYMSEDRDYTRFFTYMNLFVAAMLILVLSNNLAVMFIGWEGVGLCSYLLIGFWYRDQANCKAANKAFIVNRIGDFGFMIGTFLIFCLTSSTRYVTDGRFLSFDQIERIVPKVLETNPGLATAAALLLLLAACGKSAQLPLYFWLPDAMAGPTPVSALIHAATMVTSGVFLINRLHMVFAASPIASGAMAAIGAATALFAAVVAFGQTDIKKVLAYSTVSQLGFMFVACGAGAYSAGMFHVTTHAFFKALLFLGAGAVIHAMAHNQDMRNYGRLYKYLPVTFVTMMVGFLSISGFPYLSGFFSKEAILGGSIGSPAEVVKISGFVALFTAFLTALYMARLTWLTFLGKEERWRSIPVRVHETPEEVMPSAGAPALADPHGFFYTAQEMAARDESLHEVDSHELDAEHTPYEVPASMSLPLVLLAIPSLAVGFFLARPFDNWLYPLGPEAPAFDMKWLPIVSGAAALFGIALGWFIYRKGLPEQEAWDLSKWSPFRKLAANQFYYDYAMTEGSISGGRDIGVALNSGVDRYGVEGLVDSLGFVSEGSGLLLRKLQTGYVRFYALLMLLGVLAFVAFFVLGGR